MTVSNPERLALGFTELMVTCETVFEIPAGGRKALSSRLKHLQAKGFPEGVNVGRTKRVRYGASAIAGTLLVLALTASFMPPLAAVELVRRQWPDWARLIANAARGSKRLGGRADLSGPTYAIIETNALAQLGAADASEGRAASGRGRREMRATTAAQLGRETKRTGAAPGATVVVDVSALVDRLGAHLLQGHIISADDLARELIGLDGDGIN